MVARARPRLEMIGLALIAVVGEVGMLLFASFLILSSAYGRLMKRLRSRESRTILATVITVLAVLLLAGYLLLGLLPGDTLVLLVLIAYSPFDNSAFFHI
jgi:uncharacterized membrane protein YoaK (UPF0700 family)